MAGRRGVRCIVLAGGPHDAIAAGTPDAPNKAFALVAGRTLLERTLAPLRASSAVSAIRVVAPPSAAGHPALAFADECVPDGAKIRDSLRSGLAGLPPDKIVAVWTSDLPLLSTAAVDDFIARAGEADADIGYGCLEYGVHMRRFPEVPHTWARMREGRYCGGGAIAIKPRALPRLDDFIERLGAARKSPLRLAGLFGWGLLLRYALGRLSIETAQARASEIVGASVRAIPSPFAEFAVNVDRLSDVALAERLLASANA